MRPLEKLGITFFSILFTGCAHIQPPGPQATEKVGYLGISACPSTEGILIYDIAKGGPAEKAGIHAGDIIISVNGLSLANPQNRRELLWSVSALKSPSLILKRGDKTITATPKPGVRNDYAMNAIKQTVLNAIYTGQNVAIAIVIDQVNYEGPHVSANSEAIKAWKIGAKAIVESELESFFLDPSLLHCGNYKVVDRDKINEITSELHFQMTGAVSPELVKSIGKMTGATHLASVSVIRYWVPNTGFTDDTVVRIVEIESGNLLASVRSTSAVR